MNIAKNTKKLKTFMDFCAGIGGGRIGLSHNGLKCVAYSEIDQAADNTYKLFLVIMRKI